MSGSNDGGGNSWTSKFLKVAGAAATTAAVAASLYAAFSSSSANSEHETPFGAGREREEREQCDPWWPKQVNNKEKWEKPEVGWVKVNVDGSREHYNGPSAGCGGVVRDSSGKWVRGFAQKLDSSLDVHQTELVAILRGLELVSDMNIKKVVVESDNDSVVRMVEKGVKPNHTDYEVVHQIRAMLYRFDWEVRLVAINTKANGVADRLANNARNLSFEGLHETYLNPPPNCVHFLHRDEMGVSAASS